MVAVGQNLLALISGQRRPAVKSASPLLDLIAGRVKTAQAAPIVTADVESGEFGDSVAAMNAEADRKAYEKEHPTPQALPNTSTGFLGGDRKAPTAILDAEHDNRDAIEREYDSQPDVVADRERAENQKAWEEYAKEQNISQQKDFADLQKEVDKEGVGDFGSTGIGKSVGRFLDREVGSWIGLAGKGIGYLRDAPKGTSWSDWSKEYDKNWNAGAEDRQHDMANNIQLQGNAARHGAEQVGRFAAKWVDPRNWGSSTQARLNRMAHDNEAANADTKHNIRQIKTMANFRDSDLDMGRKGKPSLLGTLNYAGNAAVGEFAGGEAATAGIGGAAKGVSKGIVSVGAKAGARAGAAATRMAAPVAERARYIRSGFGQQARNLEATRQRFQSSIVAGSDPALATPQAFRHAFARGMGSADPAVRSAVARNAGITLNPGSLSAETRIGNAVNRGVQEIGKTVASPFTMAGTMATPITSASRGLAAGTRVAWDTGKAAVRPAGDLLHMLRHPVANTRAAAQYAMQHPFAAAGRTAAYPVRYAWDVAKPAGKAAVRVAFNPNTMYGGAMYDAYGNARAGAYGAAAGDIGTMGAFGALGPVALPAYLGYAAMRGGDQPQE